MLVGDARDALDELAVDARPQLDGGAVRADERRRRRSRSRATRRRRARARRRGSGRWKPSSGTRSTAGPGEERPVAVEPAGRRRRLRRSRGRRRRGGDVGVPRRERRVQPEVVEREVAEERAPRARRRRPARGAGRRRRSAPRASRSRRARRGRAGGPRGAGAARGPRGSSTCRRARARPVAGRIRSAQPAASSWNIVSTMTRFACSASARTSGFAAASSPETTRSSIGSGFVSSASAATAQPSATPRGFAAAGRWNAPQPGLSSKPELVRELRDPRAAAAARARPDEDGALRRAELLREGAPPGGELAAASRRRSRARSCPCPSASRRRPRRRAVRASLIQRSTIGARSTTGSSPTTTTISASRDRAEREPERLERVRRRLRQHRGVRVEPAAEEPPERVRDLGRLRARERRDDRAARLAQHRLGLVERVVPRDLLEPLPPAAERRRDPVLGARGAGTRSGPCRRASRGRSPGGCARGSA